MARAVRVYRERSGEVARPGTWWKGVKGRARAIVQAPGKLSSRELAERATGIFGTGILKPHAVGRSMGQAAKFLKGSMWGGYPLEKLSEPSRKMFAREYGKQYTSLFHEMLATPQREFSRLKGFDLIREVPQAQLGGRIPGGLFSPRTQKASVSPIVTHDPGFRRRAFRHEVRGHGREARPEPFRPEMRQVQRMGAVDEVLRSILHPEDFYRASPAENVARKIAKSPRMSDKAYRQLVESETTIAEAIAENELAMRGYSRQGLEKILRGYEFPVTSRRPRSRVLGPSK